MFLFTITPAYFGFGFSVSDIDAVWNILFSSDHRHGDWFVGMCVCVLVLGDGVLLVRRHENVLISNIPVCDLFKRSKTNQIFT